jgi:hypothetical protein
LFVQVRPRHVRVRRRWVVAAAVALVTAVVLGQRPPRASNWPWLAAAGLAGLVVGAMRANLTNIRAIDLAGDALDVQNTRLGVLVWEVALVARVGLRQLVGHSNPSVSRPLDPTPPGPGAAERDRRRALKIADARRRQTPGCWSVAETAITGRGCVVTDTPAGKA